MLNLDNSDLDETHLQLETFAPTSLRAKFVAMNDDSMAPDFMPGDHILFDPLEVPRAGDTVLVRLASHEHFVRLFRPRTAYVFEAVAVNPNYQPLSSLEDGALVVAVMVEHRRYRRRP
jgi:phage repressor protein C with HTH and peptisase S24 domain